MKPSARWVVLLIGVAACKSEPKWSATSVAAQLGSAGYVVSGAPNPGIAGPGVMDVQCLSAARSGATDTVCVVQCDSVSACTRFAEGTWESYGVFQRRASLLVHQVCGRPTGHPLSFDCTGVREALDL